MFMTLEDNPTSRKKSGMAYATPIGSMRYYKFVLQNSRLANIDNHNVPIIMFFGRYNEEGLAQNLTFENSSYTNT